MSTFSISEFLFCLHILFIVTSGAWCPFVLLRWFKYLFVSITSPVRYLVLMRNRGRGYRRWTHTPRTMNGRNRWFLFRRRYCCEYGVARIAIVATAFESMKGEPKLWEGGRRWNPWVRSRNLAVCGLGLPPKFYACILSIWVWFEINWPASLWVVRYTRPTIYFVVESFSSFAICVRGCI